MKVEVKNDKEIVIGKAFGRFSGEREVPFFISILAKKNTNI